VKTGTSTDFRGNWTAGYTTEVAVAVWVGNFSGRPMRKSPASPAPRRSGTS